MPYKLSERLVSHLSGEYSKKPKKKVNEKINKMSLLESMGLVAFETIVTLNSTFGKASNFSLGKPKF